MIFPMPAVEVPSFTTSTITAVNSFYPLRLQRLVCAEAYPTLFLENVVVGIYYQLPSDVGICLSTFHREKDLDEVLLRLRAGQTFAGSAGSTNVGLVEAVEALTRNFPCENVLNVGQILSMRVVNRGTWSVRFSCYWEGEEV